MARTKKRGRLLNVRIWATPDKIISWMLLYFLMVNFGAVALSAGSIVMGGGGTGLLHVPDAGLMEVNSFEYMRTNGWLSLEPGAENFRRYRSIERYETDHVAVSILPRMEIGFRLSTGYNRFGRRSGNDLTGHLKFNVFDWEGFRFAVGARDFAGEAINGYPSNFAVLDYTQGNIRFVGGYGSNEDKHSSLSGPFGGVRYAAKPWLDLLVDYDGIETHAGFRLSGRMGSTQIYGQAYTSTNDGEAVYYQLGFRLALGRKSPVVRSRRAKPAVQKEPVLMRGGADDAFGMRVERALTKERWNRYELLRRGDGAGGVGERYKGEAKLAESGVCGDAIDIRANNIPMLQMRCNQLGGYDVRWQTTWSTLSRWQPEDWGHLHLRAQPGLRYAIGTEWGRGDYDVDLRLSATFAGPLGFGAYIFYAEPGFRSRDYEAGERFGGSASLEPSIPQKGWNWTGHLLPGWFVQWSQGLVDLGRDDAASFKRAEVLGSLWDGRLMLNYHNTRLANQPRRMSNRLEIGRVFYWLVPQSYAAIVSFGEHLFKDKGARVDVYKYFDRVRLGMYYKNGDAQNGEGNDKAVGFTFMMQLAPDRQLGNRWVSFGLGDPQFTLGLETSIQTGTGMNDLQPFLLNEFAPLVNLTTQIGDRWRMSPHYIRTYP